LSAHIYHGKPTKRSDEGLPTCCHTTLQKLAGRDMVEVLERIQIDLVRFAARLNVFAV
jgi:hypothetical protein